MNHSTERLANLKGKRKTVQLTVAKIKQTSSSA